MSPQPSKNGKAAGSKPAKSGRTKTESTGKNPVEPSIVQTTLNIEELFLEQVMAFEDNFYRGIKKTFAETVGTPPLPPWLEVNAKKESQLEKLVDKGNL